MATDIETETTTTENEGVNIDRDELNKAELAKIKATDPEATETTTTENEEVNIDRDELNKAELAKIKATDPEATENKRAYALIATELANRLKIGTPAIGRNRKRKSFTDFAIWSKARDPDGIAWQFLRTDVLPRTGHNRAVDIYVPIAPGEIENLDLQKIDKEPTQNSHTYGAAQPQQEKVKTQSNLKKALLITQEQSHRLNTIANRVNLRGGNACQQLTHLLNWVDTRLESDTLTLNSTVANKVQPSVDPPSVPINSDRLERAIETIAKFSQNLHHTLVPLTQLLQDAIAIVLQDRPQGESPTTTITPPPTSEQPIPNPYPTADDKGQIEATKIASNQTPPINAIDIKPTIDALNTAIALKHSAIAKEKKKRSKVDNELIAQWEQEIQSLERSIEFLQGVRSQ